MVDDWWSLVQVQFVLQGLAYVFKWVLLAKD